MNNPKPKFELTRVKNSPVSDEELISDLRLVASQLERNTVPMKLYEEFGNFDYTTISRRFGSWNKALTLAGLSVSNEINLSDERLYENLLVLWLHFGRQPSRRELSKPPSIISQGPYNRRFGSWTAALEAFVEYANAGDAEMPVVLEKSESQPKTGRDPSLRLRWYVLQRDRFTCCSCGKSPALSLGVELHIDHIKPWSKGGETILENLQTLCSMCNLGKSNV
jgi:hypothetical protein